MQINLKIIHIIAEEYMHSLSQIFFHFEKNPVLFCKTKQNKTKIVKFLIATSWREGISTVGSQESG